MTRLQDLSLVSVANGPRGSGKTLYLTHRGCECLLRAAGVKLARELIGDPFYLPRAKVNVWSNYPIKAPFRVPGQEEKVVMLETLPLDVEKLMTWAPEFRDGVILFDEVDQAADRQEWQSQLPRLLVKGVKLMRHRNLSMEYALQFLDELNVRLYKQADVVTDCRDMVFGAWGKSVGLEGGAVIDVAHQDKSGVVTGRPYHETGRKYHGRFYSKRYWGAYSTYQEHDFLEYSGKRYEIKKETRQLVSAEMIEQEQRNEQAVYTAVAMFVYDKPGEKVKSADFGAKLKELGCDWAPAVWGKFLHGLGIQSSMTHGSAKYDFSNVELDKVLG